MEPTVRYTDAELEEFRALILAKIEKSEEDLRILKEQFTNNMDNGTLIAQVPLKEDLKNTFEDNSITNKAKRTEIFGQYDHVRVYGMDYYTRLQNVGFKTKAIDFLKDLRPEEKRRFALPEAEKIPVATK